MRKPRDARLANLLGAVATGLTDRIQTATAEATQLDGSATSALVALLDFSPSGSVHTLSQIVGLTHSGGVRLVNRLVDAGLVERGPGGDARSVTVGLTSHGRTVAQQVRDARAAEIMNAMTGLTVQQRTDLTHACEMVIANVTRHRLEQRAAGEHPAGRALCRRCDFDACGRRAGNCPAARAAASPVGPSSRHSLARHS
jgi:DNA-binding MarR family transcriptional regulator